MVRPIGFCTAFITSLALIIMLALPVHALVLPDLKAGFDYNIRQSRIAPSLTIELFEIKRWAVDFGLTVDVLYFSLGYNIVPIVEICPHFFFGYNVHEQDWCFGIGITWVKW